MPKADPATNHSSIAGLAGAAVCGLGAGLAGYSVLVKLAAVPCFSASCGAVINSQYGALMGIPVGIFGLFFWGVLPWLPGSGCRAIKAVLVLGSIAFILLQALVLQRFCPICLAHAAACLAVAPLPISRRPASAAVYTGLVLALVAAAGLDNRSRQLLRQGIEGRAVGSDAAGEVEVLPGLAWLSPEPLEDTRLVISLSCGQCQRILEELLADRPTNRRVASLLFLTEEGNEAVARLAVAAVLSANGADPVAAFTRVLVVLLEDPAILARDDADTAGFLLGAEFPELETFLEEADGILAAHAGELNRLGISSTPALVVEGRPMPYERSAVAAD